MMPATRQTRINALEHAAERLELEHAAKKLAAGKPGLVALAKQAKALREEIRRLIVTP